MPTFTEEQQETFEEFDSILSQARKKLGAAYDDRFTALDEQIRVLKQRSLIAVPPGSGIEWDRMPRSLGAAFLKSSQWKIFRETGQKRSGQFGMEMKATGPLIAPAYPVPVARAATAPNVYPQQVLRTLLRPVPVREGGIEYLRQKPTTGTAGVQWPQGATKAQLSMEFELATANIATVAEYTKASRQVLADDAQVEDIIDSELSYQVKLAEEKEILSGDGSAGRMQGLLTLAPVFTPTAGTSAIDIIGQAQGAIGALGYQVSGTLVNPADWTAMQQAKAEGTGTYLIGNPGQGAAPPYLWNVPLVPSEIIAQGTFLTGAFGTAAQLYDREQRLEVALENEDDFIRDLCTFLGEIRSALVVRRPSGFLQGSLTAPAGVEANRAKR